MIFRILQWGIGALVMAALLYLIALNPQETVLILLPGGATDPQTLPLYVIILALFITGYISALLYATLGQIPKAWKNAQDKRALEKQIKALEKEAETYAESEYQAHPDEHPHGKTRYLLRS